MNLLRSGFCLGTILALAAVGAAEADKDRYGDDLPPGAVARLGSVRFLHGPGMRDAVFSADGKTLISAGVDVLRFWDVATGRQTRVIDLEAGSINKMALARLSRDGRRLATIHVDHWPKSSLIRIWDATTGRKLRQFEGPGGTYEAFELSADGERLAMNAVGDHSGKRTPGRIFTERILIWDTATGNLLRRLEGSRAAIAFSPDSKLLASAVIGVESEKPDRGGKPPMKVTLFLCDLATGRLVQEHELEAGRNRPEGTSIPSVGSLAFSPDGKFLAAGLHDAGTNYRLRLWDVTAGKEIAGVDDHARVAFGTCFSPDGKTLVAQGGVGWSSELHLLDAATGKTLRRFPGGECRDRFATFSADGRTLAVLGTRLRLIDVATRQEQRPSGGAHGPVAFLAFDADGKSLVVADAAGAGLWDLATSKETCRVTGAGSSYAWDGKVLSALDDTRVRRWDLAASKALPNLTWERKVVGRVFPHALVLSSDGQKLGGRDVEPLRFGATPPPNPTPLRLFDLATGKQLRVFGEPLGGHTVAFSPDGKTLASVGARGVSTWDTATGKKVATLVHAPDRQYFQPPRPLLIGFTLDGKVIAVSESGNEMQVFDAVTGKKQISLAAPAGVRLRSFAFAPDGKSAATGCDSGEVRVWDVASGKERRVLTGGRGGVGAVAFAPDGKRLAAGSDDTTVLVWDLERK